MFMMDAEREQLGLGRGGAPGGVGDRHWSRVFGDLPEPVSFEELGWRPEYRAAMMSGFLVGRADLIHSRGDWRELHRRKREYSEHFGETVEIEDQCAVMRGYVLGLLGIASPFE